MFSKLLLLIAHQTKITLEREKVSRIKKKLVINTAQKISHYMHYNPLTYENRKKVTLITLLLHILLFRLESMGVSV